MQFAHGIQTIKPLSDGGIFLEVGPGRVLCTLAAQNLGLSAKGIFVPSLADSSEGLSDSATFLRAAGTLWVKGVELDWRSFHSRPRLRCPLPTYPFERERHWIDPPMATPGMPVDDFKKVAGSGVVTIPEKLPTGIRGMRDMVVTQATQSRKDRLLDSLIILFRDLSGLAIEESNRDKNFLELGFDSLFLTQIAQAIQARFGVKIAFRKLLDEVSSLNSVAGYLDAQLLPDAFPAPVSNGPPTPAVSEPSPNFQVQAGSSITVESLIREQLQTMSQLMVKQLEVFRGTVTEVASEAPASPVARATQSGSLIPEPALRTATDKFTPFRPIQTGSADGVTDCQSKYINALIERYTAKTPRSKSLTQAHRHILADPRVAAGFRSQWKEMVYPLVVDKSRGSRLWDVDGNEYIDILNGYGAIMFGHAPDFVTHAIAEQLKRGFEIGPLTPLAGQVADLVCELTGMERASFCGTGSEAVMAALRLARTVTGRSRIVLFAGSYHGNFGEVLIKAAPRGSARQSLAAAPGIPPEMVANATVLDYGSSEALDYIRAHAEELAAVLVEPVQSRHPSVQPVEFLREVRRLTETSGTALIFDEVVTGFRTHLGGVQALFGIRADLATYGKVIAGGLPFGV